MCCFSFLYEECIYVLCAYVLAYTSNKSLWFPFWHKGWALMVTFHIIIFIVDHLDLKVTCKNSTSSCMVMMNLPLK